MKQEVVQVSQLVFQLKKSYEINRCTQCLIMQHYFKKEYDRIHTKLQSLERMASSNKPFEKKQLVNIQQEAGILGMYVMV